MDTKIFLYGVFVGVLVVGLIGVINTNTLIERIDELETNLTELNSQLGLKNTQMESLTEQTQTLELISQTLSASIDGLKDSLTASQMNSTMLKTRLKELEANVTIQMSTIRLLDEAIQIIGTGEIENLLRQYAETTFQLESLQEGPADFEIYDQGPASKE
jgi:chromosome segregation ATPase